MGLGHLRVKRDTVEGTFKDGGGEAPNGDNSLPGESFAVKGEAKPM